MPELRRECPKTYYGTECDNCQGRGWVLIPAAEVMGVLVRLEKQIRIWWVEDVYPWRAAIGPYGGHGDTPEEAAAHAICQAQGIE